jgi:hypothetical protein
MRKAEEIEGIEGAGIVVAVGGAIGSEKFDLSRLLGVNRQPILRESFRQHLLDATRVVFAREHHHEVTAYRTITARPFSRPAYTEDQRQLAFRAHEIRLPTRQARATTTATLSSTAS